MEDKIAHTEDELKKAIQKYHPGGTGAEHNLMRFDMILRSQGSSLGKLLDSMKVEGSPFLKLASRD